MKLNLLTPERKAVYETEITEVSVPAYKGEITILPGHAQLMTTLGTGIVKYKAKGEEKIFKAVISWGYCEVNKDFVNVLAEFIQFPEEVTYDAAKEDLKLAEKKLTCDVLDDAEYNSTMNKAEIARAEMEMLRPGYNH